MGSPATYGDVPWYKKPGTSEAAAKAMAAPARSIRDQVEICIQAQSLLGLTADECASKLKLSILTVRPRFSELAKLNRIEDTGERRPNASKKMAAVWKAVAPVDLAL